ncbi:MAG: metallophosphoesterase family protein [Thermosynechococcaceae cyanobacterium]
MKILWASLAVGGSLLGAYGMSPLFEPLLPVRSQVAQSPQVSPPSEASPPKPAGQTTDPVIAAAGDIACVPDKPARQEGAELTCQMKATSDLLLNQGLAAVLPLGDLQYEHGESEGFEKSYDPTWGRVKAISHPVVGNHEYYSKNAAGYYRYFGEAAGDPTKGYYSYDIGNWHVIALNSNCEAIGGCQAGSPQEQWLQQDLAQHPNACTLAYWHHPRFSSGIHGNNQDMDAFWQALHKAGAEIVFNGHDHHYERFAPQTPTAQPDTKGGIREFVIGTGGKNLRPVLQAQANSDVRNDSNYGVLKLTLKPHGYAWQFVPIAGQSFTDSGQDICH